MKDIHNFVHGLSQLNFHYKPRVKTDLYLESTRETKDDVVLLDGVSLLLVFKEKDDVAAAGLWTTKEGHTVYWAKNFEVIKPAELDYVKALFKYVQTKEPVQKMLELVVPACKAKILARANNLAKDFDLSKQDPPSTRPNLFGYTETNEIHRALRIGLIRHGQLLETESVSNRLDAYLRATAQLSKQSTYIKIVSILMFSHVLSTQTPIDAILPASKARHIHKLGDYCRTLQELRVVKTKLEKRGQSLSIEQVSD